MTPAVRALRGATRVDADTPEQINKQVGELINEMLTVNGIDEEDLISVIITATDDVTSMFPAAAARAVGLGAVPLLCAREISVAGAMTRVIRVLMHFTTERSRADLRPVYLAGTEVLRDDLPAS